MKFDPEKPFGTVHGIMRESRNARYSQGPYLYDAHRRCLNPNIQPKEEKADPVGDATDELKKDLSAKADAALVKLQRAKDAKAAEATPSTKRAYTVALNAFNALQEKLEKLSE